MYTSGNDKKKLIGWLLLSVLIIGLTVGGFLLNKNFNILSRASLSNEYDVVVVGASSGGVSAAIEAARLGSKVLLIEETDMIGGQLITVPTMDLFSEDNFGGLYSEFMTQVKSYYSKKGLSIGTCYWSSTYQCYEPHVAKDILQKMINAEKNLTLMTQLGVKSVVKTGSNISGLLLTNNKQVKVKYVIDATEYGDVIMASGDNYRIGNKTNTNSTATACIQDITYTAVVRKYKSIPNELKITKAPPGYTDAVKKVFRNTVVKNGTPNALKYPVSPGFHNAYRGLPDSQGVSYTSLDFDKITKTTLNWANDYPSTPEGTGTLSTKYLYDKSYRTQVNCDAKLRTIQFIYYMQTELGMTNWSVANDEGFNTAYNRNNTCANIPAELKAIEYNMPQIPYVRESVRGIGSNTLTAKQLDRTVNVINANSINSKSISLGDYNVDLHDCASNSTLEASLETESDSKPSKAQPFQVPADILYSSKINNLIYAEKNISQSRLANGATRVQPSTMTIGQASGTLASLAIKQNKSLKNVAVRDIQRSLIAHNAVLVRFKDVPKSLIYFKDIQSAAVEGIFSGYGNLTFRPDGSVSRFDAANLIAKTFNLRSKSSVTKEFVGLPRNNANAAIYALYDNGITSGCSAVPFKFCESDNITLEQLGIFVYRSIHLNNPQNLSKYTVNGKIADVTAESKSFLLDNKLAGDCNSSNWNACARKSGSVSRAELARILVTSKDLIK